MRPFLFALAAMMLAPASVHAQGIDSLFVEVYNVQPDTVPNGLPLVTYRIFLDLAPGYQLQMVYGDEHNPFRLSTTTSFFNDLTRGARYGGKVSADHLNTFPLALDSWLTINAASDHHVGVPRVWDTDGSMLECPPYAGYGLAEASPQRPLCSTDGLLAVDSVPDVVDFHIDPAYLGTIRGSVLYEKDGAWAVLGGTKGITEHNVYLLAQITTTGQLAYRFNVQVRTPDRQVVRYVSTEARATDEVFFPGLVRP